MTKEKTTDEIREEFLAHVWHLIHYWATIENGGDTNERLEGVVFSLLTTLDGMSGGMPGFIVAPFPHETDKAYAIEHGEDYYPYNDESHVRGDIAGHLHDLFYAVGKKNGYKK